MTRPPVYRLPTQGAWHTTLDDIEPDARPNRNAQPPSGATSRPPRRKVAVARRSRARLAPGGTYFYWCENCDYCNTPDEGQQARCANHQRAHEADRKTRQRKRAEQGGAQASEYRVSRELIAEIYDLAEAMAAAARVYERALHRGNPEPERRVLNDAIRSMARTVTKLPNPHG